MANSSSINQRVVLTGAEEVRRHLEQIGQAGERSGNQVRASLLAATAGTNSFTAGARSASASSGQMRFALQNLSFQVNDVATSLASGGDVARVFAQQGGQIFQVFQQGGGAGAVLGAAATAIRSMITPMTLAAAAAVALAAGFALVIARAVSSESSARQFDVILKATGKSGLATGKDLEKLSETFRDVGLNSEEARKGLQQALREGIRPADLDKTVRAGAELNAVFGEGSLEKFISAAATGGAPLEEFAKKLGIIPGVADDTAKGLKAAAEAASKANEAFAGAFRKRNQAIADEQRSAARQLLDLTRQRGTEQQELELSSQRRIEDINRDHGRSIAELTRQRNEENARSLAEFNQQIVDAAQKALDKQSLVNQIFSRVLGSSKDLLGPLGKALRDLNTAWNDFVTSLARSEAIAGFVSAMGSAVVSVARLVQGEFSVQALGVVILAALPVFAALQIAAIGVTAALGPIGLLLAIGGVVAAFLDWNKAWEGAKAAADGFLTLLKAVGEWLGRGFVEAINSAFSPINNLISWLQGLINKAIEAAHALGGIFGGAGAPVETAPIPTGATGGLVRAATGGIIRGPGTGTSDSIAALLSDGEYVVNARSTAMYLPLLQAINSLRGLSAPLVPRARRYATGGMVTAGAGGGGGAPVYLTFPGGGTVGPMMADRQVRDALVREARRAKIRSPGTAPSWVG